MRMARKPSAVARELLRNFPKPGSSRRRRRKKGGGDKPKGNGKAPEREVLDAEKPKDAEARAETPADEGADAVEDES